MKKSAKSEKNIKAYLVTVVTDDRVGIIRDVTRVLFNCGANITDLGQNVWRGVFTLHCVAEFNGDGEGAFIALSQAFENDPSAEIGFRELRDSVSSPHRAKKGGHYVAAISGPDRPGRICLVTTVLAKHGANVEDWRHDLSDRGNALTIGLVSLPHKADVAAIAAELKEALAPQGLAVSLRHENIFRATNEVGPIESLLPR